MGLATIAKQVNNIGSEVTPDGSPPPSPPKRVKEDASWKRTNWLIGFALSALPVFVGPFLDFLLKKPITEAALSFFTDTSLLFIGVSLTVSAMNDLEPEQQSRLKGYIVLLAFGSAIYSIITIANRLVDPALINHGAIIVMNIIFLVVPLVLGLSQYSSETGVKNNG